MGNEGAAGDGDGVAGVGGPARAAEGTAVPPAERLDEAAVDVDVAGVGHAAAQAGRGDGVGEHGPVAGAVAVAGADAGPVEAAVGLDGAPVEGHGRGGAVGLAAGTDAGRVARAALAGEVPAVDVHLEAPAVEGEGAAVLVGGAADARALAPAVNLEVAGVVAVEGRGVGPGLHHGAVGQDDVGRHLVALHPGHGARRVAVVAPVVDHERGALAAADAGVYGAAGGHREAVLGAVGDLEVEGGGGHDLGPAGGPAAVGRAIEVGGHVDGADRGRRDMDTGQGEVGRHAGVHAHRGGGGGHTVGVGQGQRRRARHVEHRAVEAPVDALDTSRHLEVTRRGPGAAVLGRLGQQAVDPLGKSPRHRGRDGYRQGEQGGERQPASTPAKRRLSHGRLLLKGQGPPPDGPRPIFRSILN